MPPDPLVDVILDDKMFVVVRVGEDRVHASSWDAVCCYLIPDYEDTPDEDDRLTLRAAFAAHAQTHLQRMIVAVSDLGECAPTERKALNRNAEDPAPTFDVWRATVPLILSVTDYAPWTETSAPEARPADGSPPDTYLWWVDPTTDESLITSLADLGYLSIESVEQEPW